MSTRQYIGARYVPKFADPIEWNINNSYEALTIVTYHGNSFTSKKPVPTGTSLDNTEYWVATGNYNAQVEEYIQEVETVRTNTNDLSIKVNNIDNGYINVKAYGAVGDGVTDDTQAFASAISQLGVKGNTVFIPNGVYKLTKTLVIKKSNVSIIGESMYGTILTRQTDYGNTFTVDNGLTTCVNFSGFAIHSANQKFTGAHFYMRNCQECYIENIWTENLSKSVELVGCVDVTLNHVVAVGRSTGGSNPIGFLLDVNSNGEIKQCTQIKMYGCRVFGPRIDGWDVGVSIKGAEECEITNCYFGNNKYHNISVTHLPNYSTYEVTIMGCYIDAAGMYGIILEDNNDSGENYLANTKIIGNNIKGQSGDGLGGIYVDGKVKTGTYPVGVNGLIIANNTISGFKNSGIDIGKCTDVTIVGNNIGSNNFGKNSGGDGRGILLRSGCTGVNITSNRIGQHSGVNGTNTRQLYGVQVVDGCDYVLVCNNDLTGNQTSSLIPELTHKIDANNFA